MKLLFVGVFLLFVFNSLLLDFNFSPLAHFFELELVLVLILHFE